MGTVIHTRVVIDMATMAIEEDEHFEYDGPLALCGGGSGGGSSTTTTVDYSYNWRMATLSEEQQAWAREYFSVWQEYQKPYEIAQAKANLEALPLEMTLYKTQLNTANELLPLESGYARGQLEAANQALPQQAGLYRQQLEAVAKQLPLETKYAQGQLEAANRMQPKETDLYGEHLDTASELLPEQAEAARQFLRATAHGVDVNERMALAAADTSNAWKDARAATERLNARLGINPNSGRFQGIMAAMDVQEAAQVAGAKTQARVGAEQENFTRLAQAAGLNVSGQILQGAQAVKPQPENISNNILQGTQATMPNLNKSASNEVLQGAGYLQG